MRSLAPAILAVLVTVLAAVDRAANAGPHCLAGPNATAPQGKHWYYRLDGATHHKCWYLGPKGAKLVRRAVPTTRHATARWSAPMRAPIASARQVAPLAPTSPEGVTVVTPAVVAETASDAALVSREADAADAVAPPSDDAQQATRVPDRIAERPEPTMDERARAQPPRQNAAAAIINERPSLRTLLASVALLLAVIGVILLRAARRTLRRLDLDEVATSACGGIRRGRREVAAQAVAVQDPNSAAFMPAALAPGNVAAGLPDDIEPVSPVAIDMPGVEQSVQQLRRARERLAA
jgi:hypothetical protein